MRVIDFRRVFSWRRGRLGEKAVLPHGASAETTMAIVRRLMDRGRLDEALRLAGDVLRAHPGHPLASLAAAEIALLIGDPRLAERVLRDSIAAGSRLAAAWVLLGKLGSPESAGAEGLYRRAATLEPEFPGVWFALLDVFARSGRTGAGIAALRRAARGGGDPVRPVMATALALTERGDAAAAEALYRACLEVRPDAAPVRFNLAVLDALSPRAAGGAVGQLRRTIATAPDMAVAYTALGRRLARRGDTAAALRAHGHADRLAPDDIRNADDHLFLRLTQPDTGLPELARAVDAWRERFGRLPAAVCHANPPDPVRPLRLAYVGAILDPRHSVGYFLGPLLAGHDRGTFDIHLYSETPPGPAPVPDDRRHGTAGLPPDAVAEQIRRDGIDVAVHVLGRAYNDDRSLAFLQGKPAPVQIALHHCMTTGMDAFDLFLGDPRVTPATTAEPFTERVFRLPHLFHFAPPDLAPDAAPAVSPGPAARSGFPTLGFSGGAWKLNADVIARWGEVMRRVPSARLALKLPGLDRAERRDRLARRFAEHGVPARRLILEPPVERFADHLAWYAAIDAALDSLPYGGGNSILEALWMGVPTLTVAGDRFAGRMGHAILTTAGLDRWMVRSPAGYAERAAALLADTDELAAERAGLRDRLRASPLMDDAAYTRRLERVYRAAWRRWCARQARGDDPARPD